MPLLAVLLPGHVPLDAARRGRSPAADDLDGPGEELAEGRGVDLGLLVGDDDDVLHPGAVRHLDAVAVARVAFQARRVT